MDHSIPHVRILLLALLAGALACGVVYVDRARGASAASPVSSTVPGAASDAASRAESGDDLQVTAGHVEAEPARADQGAGEGDASGSTAPARAAAAGTLVAASVEPAPPVTPAKVRLAGGVPCAAPHQVVHVNRDVPVMTAPRSGRSLGTLPARSSYLGQPMSAWIRGVSADGAWGRVTVPWFGSSRAGWARIDGFARSTTRTMVVADLSKRQVSVLRDCDVMFTVPAAIGAAGSPSPTGRYFVTDRVSVPSSQPQFGSYAFGLSATQPNTPAGWTGGNQMAIHGTNSPSSIGSAASAGCLRVSERSLDRLRPLLRPGTPVVIVD